MYVEAVRALMRVYVGMCELACVLYHEWQAVGICGMGRLAHNQQLAQDDFIQVRQCVVCGACVCTCEAACVLMRVCFGSFGMC